MKKILVTYASKYGATKEIAEKISETLQNSGFETICSSTEKVNDLSEFQAVILGSALYMGQWRKPAVSFIKNNTRALIEKDVWIFSSGPSGPKKYQSFHGVIVHRRCVIFWKERWK